MIQQALIIRIFGKLKILIRSALYRHKSKKELFIIEDIIINNKPALIDSPFYEDFAPGARLTDLKPHAERIYSKNLKLQYKKNDLLKKSGSLWITPEILNNNDLSRDMGTNFVVPNSFHFDYLKKKNDVRWEYILRDDNLNNFIFGKDRRQWIKRFEECAMFPIVYGEIVILRNEYRLFCIDLFSGREIWSLGISEKRGDEFYITFRHPHHNSHDYQLLLHGDKIFTELNGTLVAVDLSNILNPRIIWKISLGEYTFCMAPVLNNDILVAGLINARMEIFICGFNVQGGALEWSTYIGTSSFLSPPSNDSVIIEDRVFLGSNHGIILCIDSNNGKINWLRRYNPKSYNVLDYWKASCFKGFSTDKDPIGYDTHFLKFENGFLYYKPRESDYLYVLDAKNGELKKEVQGGPNKSYILSASEGAAIFLRSNGDIYKTAELVIVELASNKVIHQEKLENGELRGAIYENNQEIIFKVGNRLHFLRTEKNNIKHATVDSHAGWLLNSLGQFLFIGNNNTLSMLNLYGENDINAELAGDIVNNYFEKGERILESFQEAAQIDPASDRAGLLREQVLSGLRVTKYPVAKFMLVIIKNLDKLRNPSWNSFFVALQEFYAEEVVAYRDIKLRFINFLIGSGLLVNFERKGLESSRTLRLSDVEINSLELFGDRLVILPLNIFKGPKLLDLFILVRFDQLICVSDSGNILWYNKVFNPCWDDISAYLYDHILVVKDRMNIIAFNINDGTYLWSITNQEEQARGPGPIKFDLKFLDGNIIIVKKNKIYSVDHTTGFCENFMELDMVEVKEISTSGNRIYLLSDPLDKLKIIDSNFSSIADLSLDFLAGNNEIFHVINFMNNCIILHVGSNLYILDSKEKRLKGKTAIESGEHCFIDAHNDNLLIISPSKKIISYNLSNGLLVKCWEVDFLFSAEEPSWGFSLNPKDFIKMWNFPPPKKSEFYFILEDKIFSVYKHGEDYFLASISFKTGEVLWSTHLYGVKGVFDKLSNYQIFGDSINFIISTKCHGDGIKDYADYQEAFVVDLSVKLFRLDIANGEIINKEDLNGSYKYFGVPDPVILETKHCFIYCVHGLELRIENKDYLCLNSKGHAEFIKQVF